MHRVVAIQHVAFEDLGTLDPVLRAAGFSIELLNAGVDSLTPVAADPPDLLIVLGGPIGVYEEDAYPWLRSEIDLLAGRLGQRRPTLGICLGAQLMAAALGSRVFPGTNGKEIGWSAIEAVTEPAPDHPLGPLFEPGVEVLHWHGDTFDLPPGAKHLARSARYPAQAFSVGEHALALQFHAEVVPRNLERWYIGHAAELSQANVSVPRLRSTGARMAPQLAERAPAMWEAWIRRALASSHQRKTNHR